MQPFKQTVDAAVTATKTHHRHQAPNEAELLPTLCFERTERRSTPTRITTPLNGNTMATRSALVNIDANPTHWNHCQYWTAFSVAFTESMIPMRIHCFAPFKVALSSFWIDTMLACSLLHAVCSQHSCQGTPLRSDLASSRSGSL